MRIVCRAEAERRGLWSGCVGAVFALSMLACGGDASNDAPPMKDKEPTGVSELGTSTTDAGPEPPPGDGCDGAVEVHARTWRGTLVAAKADLAAGDPISLDATCGIDGPDVFVRRRIERRADVTVGAIGTGFVPRVAILDGACANDLGCASGLPLRLLDVAAGSEIVVAVAIPGEALEAVGEAPETVVTIDQRLVLAAGESCEVDASDDTGRCESGTACVASAGAATCTPVAGDTCGRAIPIAVAEPATVVVDPRVPYSDAHAHACAGERRRDVVFLVSWDGALGSLVVASIAEGVALGARAPDCAADHEAACDPPSPSGASIVVAAPSSGLASAYVFVELPADGDPGPAPEDGSELGPFEVSFRIEPPSPTTTAAEQTPPIHGRERG